PDQLRAELLDQTNPQPGLEMITFNLLARAAWQLESSRQIEAKLADPFGPEAEKIAKYITRAERSYYRALKELGYLQAERTDIVQNEPNLEQLATRHSSLANV